MQKENQDLRKVSFQLEFSAKELDYILSGCFEGGSNYWISKVKVKNEDYKGAQWASDCVTKGGILLLTEDCNEVGADVVTHELDEAKLLKGLAQYGVMNNGIDFDNLDAGQYDLILQYALFNEAKYG